MSTPADPLVSIVVPSYNQGRYIARTLDSILAQDYRPLEIVVMDGGSKDETVAVLEDYARRHPELRWVSEKDRGVAHAVNKGLAAARGTLVGIQSSDDIYYAGAIRLAVETFRRQPELGLVYGDSGAIDVHDHLLWRSHWAPFSIEKFLLGTSKIPQASAFFRLDLARELQGWREEYFICDYEFWLRLMFRAPALKLDALMSAARLHEVRRDHQTRKIWDSYWKMVRESRELQRAPARLRRAAHAGAHSLVLRHSPYASQWRVAWHCWLALLSHPGVWPALRPRRRLLPWPTADQTRAAGSGDTA